MRACAFDDERSAIDGARLALKTFDVRTFALDRQSPGSLAEFGDDSRRHDDTSVENGQDVAVLDQNQISDRTGVSGDDHSGTLVVRACCLFGLTLLPQARTRRALALEILQRVLQRHTVPLQEPIELVPGRNVQQFAEL